MTLKGEISVGGLTTDPEHVYRGKYAIEMLTQIGKAGIKPKGDDFYTTCIEPYRDWGRNPAPGEMTFYSYSPRHAD